jgi:hypothetical protein
MMERINRFPRTRELKPGERVIVYTKHRTRGKSPGTPTPKPLAKIEAPVPDALPRVD